MSVKYGTWQRSIQTTLIITETDKALTTNVLRTSLNAWSTVDFFSMSLENYHMALSYICRIKIQVYTLIQITKFEYLPGASLYAAAIFSTSLHNDLDMQA